MDAESTGWATLERVAAELAHLRRLDQLRQEAGITAAMLRDGRAKEMVARAALALPADDGWRPIETAPKDGTVIVIAYRDWDEVQVLTARRISEGWAYTLSRSVITSDDYVFAWMPLPALPTGGGK